MIQHALSALCTQKERFKCIFCGDKLTKAFTSIVERCHKIKFIVPAVDREEAASVLLDHFLCILYNFTEDSFAQKVLQQVCMGVGAVDHPSSVELL